MNAGQSREPLGKRTTRASPTANVRAKMLLTAIHEDISNGSEYMTLTLELPQDLERRLTVEATRLGLPLEKYALRLLGEAPKAEATPTTGAEVVAYWQREGIIGSRPDIEAGQAHARAIRHRAERRAGAAAG